MRQSDVDALMVIYNYWKRTEQSVFSRRMLNGLLIVADFAHDFDEARSRLVADGYLHETDDVFELTLKGISSSQPGLRPQPILSALEGCSD